MHYRRWDPVHSSTQTNFGDHGGYARVGLGRRWNWDIAGDCKNATLRLIYGTGMWNTFVGELSCHLAGCLLPLGNDGGHLQNIVK